MLKMAMEPSIFTGKLQNFFAKKISKHKFVIHSNHKKTDNCKNLRWANLEEVSEHQQDSRRKLPTKSARPITVGLKLTATQVKTIKDAINNPKRKLPTNKWPKNMV
jgi:c-di-AMP phosphodiesterase-like protein